VARWRLAALTLLGLLLAVPLAAPFLQILTGLDRLPLLVWNTVLLAGGAGLIAVPLGTAAAVLLFRTDLPLAGLFRFLTLLTLFVPLALLTAAWQASRGAGGLFPSAWWGQSEGRPWAEGLGPAIWIHAVAALPWVTLLVGRSLLLVEADQEADALLAGGPWRMLVVVTLPRCWGAVAAATVWVVLQVAGDITVTNVMLVPTVADEVLSTFQQGGGPPLARAISIALPVSLAAAVGIYWLLNRAAALVPTLDAPLQPSLVIRLGAMKWPCFVLVTMALVLLAGVPVASLIWRTGAVGLPLSWSLATTCDRVTAALLKEGWMIVKSIAAALASAILTATSGLLLTWIAADAPRFQKVLFVLAAVALAVPGPILGIGLKETILTIVTMVPWKPLSIVLYEGPESPVPVMWAHLMRFLPCAVAVFWPVVRQPVTNLGETLRLESSRPFDSFMLDLWPRARHTWSVLVLVLTALSLGEVGATAMSVETPGWQMYAHVLFNRMHYGVAADVASLGLALLIVIASGGAAMLAAGRLLALVNIKVQEGQFPLV